MILPFLQKRGNFQGKGHIASLVPSRLRAINKYTAVIIHGAEMQVNLSLQLLCADGNGAVIPYGCDKVRVAHAAQFTFRAEGHQDLVFKIRPFSKASFQPAVVQIKFKIPCSVQVHPVLAYKLRKRMFRSRYIPHNFLHSAGCPGSSCVT